MIQKHEFNTKWLRCECGIISGLDFFLLNQAEQKKLLANYQFVELRTSENPIKYLAAIYKCGFWCVDTQIRFELDLRQIPIDMTAQQLQFERASESFFQITSHDIYSFQHERFLAIPGVTQEMVDSRYLILINDLINKYPEWCFKISHDDQTQGWYFGIPRGNEIELTLAMLHKNAQIKGKQLYNKAITIYAQQFSTGISRFSINNIAVHNILAKFGARFLAPETVWFWVNTK